MKETYQHDLVSLDHEPYSVVSQADAVESASSAQLPELRKLFKALGGFDLLDDCSNPLPE